MNRNRAAWSRRRMLQSLGLGALCTPLLPILNASGQENLAPKRLLLIFSPDGAPALNYNTTVDFRPQGSETDFTLHEIHAPLEPFKSKLVVPWGLELTAGGAGEAHAFGMAGLWTASTLNGPSAGADFDGGNGNRTGWGSGQSIDQAIAGASGPSLPYAVAPDAANQETPFRTVELGVKCQGANSLNRMIYSGENAPKHPEENPQAAFDRLLGNVTEGSDGNAEDPALSRASAEQRAIVDLLKDDLARVRTKVGAEDYFKLDAHLEGLLAIERQLQNAATSMPQAECTVGSAPSNDSAFPTEIRQMMDIATAALSCDVTRVMSLQMSYAFSHVTHTWLGHGDDHHNMSHDGQDRVSELTAIDNWYAQQVAYLLERMDSIQEGDGTLLDNTLIVWGRELGSTAHRMDRWPAVLAGGSALGLRTGRWLDVEGQQHASLLVAIAQLMGLEINGFGNRESNTGPLSGIVA